MTLGYVIPACGNIGRLANFCFQRTDIRRERKIRKLPINKYLAFPRLTHSRQWYCGLVVSQQFRLRYSMRLVGCPATNNGKRHQNKGQRDASGDCDPSPLSASHFARLSPSKCKCPRSIARSNAYDFVASFDFFRGILCIASNQRLRTTYRSRRQLPMGGISGSFFGVSQAAICSSSTISASLLNGRGLA